MASDWLITFPFTQTRVACVFHAPEQYRLHACRTPVLFPRTPLPPSSKLQKSPLHAPILLAPQPLFLPFMCTLLAPWPLFPAPVCFCSPSLLSTLTRILLTPPGNFFSPLTSLPQSSAHAHPLGTPQLLFLTPTALLHTPCLILYLHALFWHPPGCFFLPHSASTPFPCPPPHSLPSPLSLAPFWPPWAHFLTPLLLLPFPSPLHTLSQSFACMYPPGTPWLLFLVPLCLYSTSLPPPHSFSVF